MQVNGHTNYSLTFRQVLEQVNRLRASLWQLGIRKGDVILVIARNALETPVLTYAAWSLGVVLATCNPLYKKGQKNLMLYTID